MKNGVEKRGSSYSYAIRVPNPSTGKTKVKMAGGFTTEQAAKVARAKALIAISNGHYIEPSKINVEEFLNDWFANHALSLKATTIQSYGKVINSYLIPHIGKIPISQLRPTHIQKMYVDLVTAGGVNGRPLSPRTASYVGAILSKALKYAVEVEQILSVNVSTRVSKPKGSPKRLEPYSPSEARAFLAGIASHRLFAIYRLATYSGARLGELLALKWSDIDFESGKVTISKNRVNLVGGAIEQSSTKGGEGRRTVTLDPETLDFLRAHRKRQVSERLLAGSDWTDSGHVFVTEFGKPVDSRTPSSVFQKHRKRLGLREQRFHDLRHFHATQLLQAGVPLHIVAQRLGHRDPMVTATTYAHVTNDQAENVSIIFAKAVE